MYDVKGNLEKGYEDSKQAEVVFIVDVSQYKKFTKALQNSIYAILNDFKRHYSAVNPGGEIAKVHLVKYSSSFVSEVEVFEFTKQKELIEILDKANEKESKDLKGAINALNKTNEIEFADSNARFVFQFCAGNSDEEEGDINEEIRTKEFKYEIIFFNEPNQSFYEKVEEFIPVDVNIVKVA